MTGPESLDVILKRNETIVVPGAYDALSARIAARAGARVVYMTGFGVAGARFGFMGTRLGGVGARFGFIGASIGFGGTGFGFTGA